MAYHLRGVVNSARLIGTHGPRGAAASIQHAQGYERAKVPYSVAVADAHILARGH